MLPVISFKVGGDVAGADSGKSNAAAEHAAARLASYGLPTAVTFWHEPHGDMTGAQYAAASQQILPLFKRGEVRVGPLLNGWLLDRQLAAFASCCPDELFGLWDWLGIDAYEGGTMAAPGIRKPAERIYALSAYAKSRGFACLSVSATTIGKVARPLPLPVRHCSALPAIGSAVCGTRTVNEPENSQVTGWPRSTGRLPIRVGHDLELAAIVRNVKYFPRKGPHS